MIPNKHVIVPASLAHSLSVSQNSVVAFIPSPSQVSARRRRSVTVPARPQDHAHLKMSSIHAALHDYTLDTLSLNEVGDQPVCVGSSLIIPHASIGSTALHAAFLSNSGDGDVLSSLTSALAVGLVIAAAIFLYANVVYTPEIIENAQAMRQEEQAAQMPAELAAAYRAKQAQLTTLIQTGVVTLEQFAELL